MNCFITVTNINDYSIVAIFYTVTILIDILPSGSVISGVANKHTIVRLRDLLIIKFDLTQFDIRVSTEIQYRAGIRELAIQIVIKRVIHTVISIRNRCGNLQDIIDHRVLAGALVDIHIGCIQLGIHCRIGDRNATESTLFHITPC